MNRLNTSEVAGGVGESIFLLQGMGSCALIKLVYVYQITIKKLSRKMSGRDFNNTNHDASNMSFNLFGKSCIWLKILSALISLFSPLLSTHCNKHPISVDVLWLLYWSVVISQLLGKSLLPAPLNLQATISAISSFRRRIEQVYNC